MPCHHNLEEYLTAHLDGGGLRGNPKRSLFRAIGSGTSKLTRTVLPQANAYAMIPAHSGSRDCDGALAITSFERPASPLSQ